MLNLLAIENNYRAAQANIGQIRHLSELPIRSVDDLASYADKITELAKAIREQADKIRRLEKEDEEDRQ